MSPYKIYGKNREMQNDSKSANDAQSWILIGNPLGVGSLSGGRNRESDAILGIIFVLLACEKGPVN